MKAGIKRRAEEIKKAKVGEDSDCDAMKEVIGAMSDLKYDEAVDKFISQETFGEFNGAISGEVVDGS